MLSVIDRYIAKEFIKYFFAALLVFSTLYLAVDMLSSVWQLKADSSLVWAYYLCKIPKIIYQMTPVATLMSTIFTISLMSRSGELVALFSSGLGLRRVSVPIIAVAVIIAVLSFFVEDKIVPPFTKKRNYIEFVQIKKTPGLYYTVKTNKIWYRSHDLIYNIQTFNPDKHLIQGLSIYYFSPRWKLLQLINAQEATLDGSHWMLHDGSVTLFESDSSFPLTQHFDEKEINMEDKPEDIRDVDTDSDIMTAQELRRYIKRNSEAGLDTSRFEVSYFSRFSFSFVPVVMALLGIPFSVSRDKSGGFALNVGVCLGVVFIYWTLFSFGMSMGNHGTLRPLAAAWTPNIFMTSVALLLLLRTRK